MSKVGGAPDGTGQFASKLINALHRSRRTRAMQILAENAHLFAVAEEPARSCPLSKMLQPGRRLGHDGAAPRRPRRFGVLLGAIALVLIAVHAVCAAVIIDHALARGSEAVTINHAD